MVLAIAFAVSALVTGCGGPDAGQTAAVVKRDMQSFFDNDREYRGFYFQVQDVQLVRESDHKFVGQATILPNGKSERVVPIEVIYDDDRAMWQMPAGHGLMRGLFENGPRRAMT